MGNFKLCRVCTKLTNVCKSNKLFVKNHNKLIKQIKEITGILLTNLNRLPQYICKQCQQDLEKAYEFRERCIFAQEYFNTVDYLEQVGKDTEQSGDETTVRCFIKDFAIKDELPIEENHVADICFIKEETADDVFLEDTPIDNSCNDDVGADALDLGEGVEEAPLFVGSKIKSVKTKTKLKTKKPKSTDKFENTSCKLVKKERKLKISKTELSQDATPTIEKKIRKKKETPDDKNLTLICDQCGNHFTCRHHFLIHLRRHTGDRRYECELCAHKFFTHSELNRHMRKHTGEKPFSCRHCERSFSDYSTRVKHERTHTNERPFECMQCSKTFTNSYILKNHMLVHTGERFFRCDLCNKAFQRRTHLIVHYRSIMHQQNEEKQQQQQGTSNPMTEQINATNTLNIAL